MELKNSGDFDGDGEPDLVVYADGARWVVPHRMPAPRNPIVGLAFAEGNVYTKDPAGDVDGDGRDDLPVALLDLDKAGLWYGWDIPFDDPSAW